VINDITASMDTFAPLINQAVLTFKSVDADKNKHVYSRLAELLVRILLNKVILKFYYFLVKI
jgi:hypothetical protein